MKKIDRKEESTLAYSLALSLSDRTLRIGRLYDFLMKSTGLLTPKEEYILHEDLANDTDSI